MRGYSTILFDHEGAGYSDGEYENFRVSSGLDHLCHVAEWGLENVACNGQLVFFGQSLGAALALMASLRLRERMAGVVLWNLSARFDERYPSLFGLRVDSERPTCVEKGYVVGASFLRDAARFDVLSRLDEVRWPVLFLNCVGDTVGDPTIAREAERLIIGPFVQREVVEATHSFVCERAQEERATAMSFDWLDCVTGRRVSS